MKNENYWKITKVNSEHDHEAWDKKMFDDHFLNKNFPEDV